MLGGGGRGHWEVVGEADAGMGEGGERDDAPFEWGGEAGCPCTSFTPCAGLGFRTKLVHPRRHSCMRV